MGPGRPATCSSPTAHSFFSLHPHTFAMKETKVSFVINQLTGRAQLWGTVEWERRSSACAFFDWFAVELCNVFGFESCGAEAFDTLGTEAENTYSGRLLDFLAFCTRHGQSSWNDLALRDTFHHGLADYIKDELVS